MNALRTAPSTRLAGVVFAVIASVATLGATVGGMQAGIDLPTVVAMDSVTVAASGSTARTY